MQKAEPLREHIQHRVYKPLVEAMQKNTKLFLSKTSSSNTARRNHLLSQMLLVLADTAVPSRDGLILAHHYVLSDLVE